MAKSKVKKNFDLKKLARKIPGLMSSLLNARGGAIHDAIQNGIDLQEDIHGKKYKKMRRSTRLKREHRGTGSKLLDETGNMRGTKPTKATPSKLVFKIEMTGKNKDGEHYGVFHNKGDGVPKREWFGIPKESLPGGKDWKKANVTLRSMIHEAWRKAGGK